jgi:serine/threonine protein kinase
VYEVDPRAAAPGAYLLHAEPNTTLPELLAQQLDPAIFGDVVSFSNFAETLLTIDPDVRPTAAEALQHPWMASYSLPPINPPIVPVGPLPPIDPPIDPPIVPVGPLPPIDPPIDPLIVPVGPLPPIDPPITPVGPRHRMRSLTTG